MNTQVNNLLAMISAALPNEKKSDTQKLHKEKNLVSSARFLPVPHATIEDNNLPVWQVRFEVLRANTPGELCLEINGNIVLGVEESEIGVINLLKYNNEIRGVSRRHLQLSPTNTDLFMTDLDSTNGTRKNGKSTQPNTPYRIHHGDIIELGDLVLAVNFVKTPHDRSVLADNHTDIINAFTHISSAMTSNLAIDDVLDRMLEMAITLCQADEIALLLLDKQAQELYLKAEHGIADKKTWTAKIPLEKTLLVNDVLRTGEPLRNIITNGHKHEVITGYLVDAALYAPITVGEASLGLFIAMRRNKDKEFSLEDERMLGMLGKFAAIAIQDSQKSEAANLELQSKLKELSAYENITKALSKTNNLTGIYNALRHQIREQWNVENIGLWLLEEATNKLVPFPKPSFHRTYSLGEEIIGTVASRAEPILATDIKLFSEPTKSVEPTLQLLARSAACVPVVENNKVLGVLAAFSKRENEFSAEDLKLLHTFSHAASGAILNAWLFEQVDKQRATILAAVNMLPHPMMIVDQDGNIIVSNKAADAMLATVHSSLHGQEGSGRELLKPLTTLMNGLSESKWRTKEIIVGDKVYLATLEYASMIGTSILMQDVTDPVTGTSNRRHFNELAEQAFQQAKRYTKPLTALVIGLKDLKRAMDEQGLAVGHQLLRALASELRSFLRTPDILGRYQEDEFIVILPETNLENAKIAAERIIESMSKRSIMVENYKIIPRLTIGVAALDSKRDNAVDVFMEKAYRAYLLAKNDKKHPIKTYQDA